MKDRVILRHYIDNYNTLNPDAYMMEIIMSTCVCCGNEFIKEKIRVEYK